MLSQLLVCARPADTEAQEIHLVEAGQAGKRVMRVARWLRSGSVPGPKILGRAATCRAGA